MLVLRIEVLLAYWIPRGSPADIRREILARWRMLKGPDVASVRTDKLIDGNFEFPRQLSIALRLLHTQWV